MNCSQSWTTNENSTISINSSENQEKTDSSNCSSEKKDKKNLYKIRSEQIIVHRWFLSDIQSLKNQNEACYFQSSSFGCTGENGFLQWIIRFHPIAPSFSSKNFINHKKSLIEADNNSALSEISKDDENTHQNMIKENHNSLSHTLFNEILLEPIAKTLSQNSITTSEDESLSNNKLYCAFEVLRINTYEPSSEVLFETNYQVFEVSNDGILSLLKTEGRYQVHFHRALIILPHDIIFSNSSNNILFSIKLTIYECSSTVGYYPSISNNSKNIQNLSYNNNNELSIGNILWFMSIEKILTDIILCSSDNQEFHVHHLILYTVCKKFIEFNSINNQMKRIEINSINGNILKCILKYIYTSEIDIFIGEFSIEKINDLFNAIDLFELFQLKNILIKKCLNHITEKNCFQLLKIADDKQINILKNRILTFLCQQFSQIFNTDTWQQFCITRPHLYNETFVHLIRLNHLQKAIIEQYQEK